MPRGWKRSWVKFWVSECIDGSIREDLEADERGVWYDLIIYSAKCRIPGIISSNETQAISRIRLAGILNISEKLLNQTISKCVISKRISVDKKGLIHIINWEKYQSESDRVRVYQIKNTKNSDENEKPLDDNQLTTKPQPDGSNFATQVKLSKVKLSKVKLSKVNISNDFDTFWNIYPRKEDRKRAVKTYCSLLKQEITPEQILNHTQKYAEQCKIDYTERRFIKLPSTFLNATDFTTEIKEKKKEFVKPVIVEDFSSLTDEEDEKNRQDFQRMMRELSDKLKLDSQ